MYLHGLKVLGSSNEIPELVKQYRIENIIVAMPSVSGSKVRGILEICRKTSAKLKILPGVYEIIDGRVQVSKIRDVELEDLLQRDPVRLNLEEITEYLHDKRVLVTGAGGSIGSELCRQICRFRPKKVVLLDNCENNLYDIDMELGNKYPGAKIIPCLTDIKDVNKINLVFEQYQPQVVFHAAAHKHVPMMEYNPDEAVKNNVIGTRNVAEAADRAGTETFIFVSTDKAVNPTSVMGATKRVAEMVIQRIGANSKTRFAAVRFGNVLGSRGSVVPLFKKQIARGGPVTVTHPEMTRYFMTIPEAVQLVIQAGTLAQGGEIFVLDMGQPVKIVDLARDLIRLSGFKPDEDIQIKVMGIRPGEKLFEELLTKEEGMDATAHERIFIAHANGIDFDKVENILFNKLQRGMNLNKSEVVAMLKEMVPEFKRQERSQIS
jgi:FlaA1/EpsC-like NDP-sugar epimerase